VAIFALEGQHRLMGVQGLMSLIKIGRLQPYNKAKKPVGFNGKFVEPREVGLPAIL
jgi:hypothetical protein